MIDTREPFPTGPSASLQICLVSPEFAGTTHCASLGLAYTSLAKALIAAGHEVTCLYFGPKSSLPVWQKLVDAYKNDRITLIALPAITASDLVAPVNLIKSYEAYHWLKRHEHFDVIHFPEQHGPAYHTLTAKRHGLAFGRTAICVGLRNMTKWLTSAQQDFPGELAEVDTQFMERSVVAMADAVVSPGTHLFDWLADNGLNASRDTGKAPVLRASPAPLDGPIEELVYFGALESPRGMKLFCDALDCIPSNISSRLRRITFLGRESIIDGIPSRKFIEQRRESWPFEVEIITGGPSGGVMNFLRHPNRLTVIPSLAERSPYRVIECLVGGIRFLASSAGGVSDLIAPEDVNKICFEPTVGALCAMICTVLINGYQPARAAADVEFDAAPLVEAFFNAVETRAKTPDPAAVHALSIDPSNTVALKALARIHLNAGLHEAAQEACELILKRQSNDVEALQMMNEATAIEKKLTTERPGFSPFGSCAALQLPLQFESLLATGQFA